MSRLLNGPYLIIASFYKTFCNKDKSAASFCYQVAAWVLDMFCNFSIAKNHKIVNNSTTTKARGKISPYLESLEF